MIIHYLTKEIYEILYIIDKNDNCQETTNEFLL